MKSTKSKLNVRLLRRIKRHILAEPRRLYMSGFVTTGEPGKRFNSDNETTQRFAECGTAACIAGWACLLSHSKAEGGGMASVGARLLNVGNAAKVFCVSAWPDPFGQQYREAKTSPKRAKIAAARIEHLITTGE